MAHDTKASWQRDVGPADASLHQAVVNQPPVVWDLAATQQWMVRLRLMVRDFLDRIPPEGWVLIKTSTAGRRGADHEVDLQLLVLVVEEVVASRTARDVIVADGPAFGDSYRVEVERLGWASAISRFGVLVEDLNEGEFSAAECEWPIATRFLGASGVINLTKAKTHRRFGVSLASKALLGALAGRELGYPKLEGLHRYVSWILVELERLSPPVLSIIDGLGGIEGEGPLRGVRARGNFLGRVLGFLARMFAQQSRWGSTLPSSQAFFDRFLRALSRGPEPGGMSG